MLSDNFLIGWNNRWEKTIKLFWKLELSNNKIVFKHKLNLMSALKKRKLDSNEKCEDISHSSYATNIESNFPEEFVQWLKREASIDVLSSSTNKIEWNNCGTGIAMFHTWLYFQPRSCMRNFEIVIWCFVWLEISLKSDYSCIISLFSPLIFLYFIFYKYL